MARSQYQYQTMTGPVWWPSPFAGTPIVARRVQAQGADRRLDAQGADHRLAADGADQRRDAEAATCLRDVGGNG
jgi:hypothetical protein